MKNGEQHGKRATDSRQRAEELFRGSFGEEPTIVARAPARVEILGNHTDYNAGRVLSMAINRCVYVAAGACPAKTTEIVSSSFPRPVRIEAGGRPAGDDRWANYVWGMHEMFRGEGYPVRPFRAVVHGTIPAGAGVSSSAALEVAAGLALSALGRFSVEPDKLALLAQQAEHRFCGTKCGLLDQFSTLFGKAGHALLIDFNTLTHRPIPVSDRDTVFAVCPSGAAHTLADSAYNDRRQECEEAVRILTGQDPRIRSLSDISMEQLSASETALGPLLHRRAAHIVGENARVDRGVELLARGDMTGFGNLMYDSHRSSRENYENSCDELDRLVEIAREVEGVCGARLTGGGFGGATLTLLHRRAMRAFEGAVKENYSPSTRVHFVSSADGAGVE